ncbi:FHA domain-containing protein [Nocardia sp. NPDC055053]
MERLVILHPQELAGTVLRLNSGRQLVGRGARADLRLDDRYVSSAHAIIHNASGHVTVEDLGSANGTRVGGELVAGQRPLRDGDIVTFGSIDARFEQEAATLSMPSQAIRRPPPNSVTFDVGRQSGHQINNIGRDQYNSYVEQRESFLRAVAASKTKARWVFWIGMFLLVGGALGYAYFFIDGMSEFNDSFGIETAPPEGIPFFGPETAIGVPAGLICFAVAFVGQFMLIIGLIMWIVAAARARKVDQDPRHAWNSPFVR